MRSLIPVYEPDLEGHELAYVTDCFRTTRISGSGVYVDRFESDFSQYCGVPYGVAVCNGTASLHLALLAIGIGPGDEVIVPNLTFVATANAVTYTGARPVFVDCSWDTWGIDPAAIEDKIGPRTKAIIAVHLYGHPVDMDPIMAIARRQGLYVVEDAAEAHGAEYKRRRTGSLGHIASFSFYGNKVITTGEGGMVVTNDPVLAERARLLRGQGMTPNRVYWHPEVGYNYRMTNMQAAIGVAQLERIEQILKRKRWIAELYNRFLDDTVGIVRPPEQSWARNVYWMYSILTPEKGHPTRDEMRQALWAAGIETRPFFYPLTHLPPYQSDEPFPVAESLSARGLNLPSSPKLMEAEIARISEVVRETVRAHQRQTSRSLVRS